ncbi:NAD+ synthase (glutamine-hydrolysing) [Bifidobacterium bohemicum]|uniref:Glutamine-dependent NAD(+) synthetase n=1 Tax=Bifidobacterium bohemicum DSM 22767 TaxID=1437606 RepID=A0A086ZG30_9BIFI|nr:NAD+ synthase [Bifidobacterium bohemicum]KFI45480.1 glutamine-dependent NAD synthetase [Bifidobacterium bohemicum DSM 22767]SCB72116.1 NAD+ synthase (glutamine-hydrolysing) [Bifidobacterium bohemicum]
MTRIRFALAQIDTCVGDLAKNASSVLEFARVAAQRHSQVVVFPEMTLTGYPIEDLAFRATFRKAAADKAEQLAQTLDSEGLGGLYVIVGTVGSVNGGGNGAEQADAVERLGVVGGSGDSDKPTNRLVVLHDGKVVADYDKHFLPNYGVFDEFRIFAAGDHSAVLDIEGVKIGVAICEDIWQDGGPVARLADRGIDVLLTINGSPYEEGKTHTRFELARRRAKEVNAPLIYLNQVGGQDDLVFDGGSFVVDRDGTLIERSPMFMEDLSYFDFDSSSTRQPVGTVAPLRDPDEEIYTACVLGLKDYMAKNRFTGVVLGLSGGIDSALVAAMAADAVGGANVYGVSMPSMYSSDGSKDDAADLARNIGAHYDIQPIEPLFKAFQTRLKLDGVAAENLQARIRGVIVMAYSNLKNLLALATGNKSELACGYSTIYGDAVGGYAPIKDLLKTRVWELSRWRNRAAAAGVGIGGLQIVGNENGSTGVPLKAGVMIPVASIEKAPSAELRPGQKDSDSLPEYALLDKVLEAYIEKAHGRADLLRDGFDEKTVDTVMRLVDRAEWKRRQYPLGPKVTALAFGRDRRLPITSAFRE